MREMMIESKKKKLATTSIEVKEYGFSKAVWDSCPDDWKKAVGDGWEEKLECMILKWSPETKKMKNVYLVYIEKEAIVSKITMEQEKILEKISVSMEYK